MESVPGIYLQDIERQWHRDADGDCRLQEGSRRWAAANFGRQRWEHKDGDHGQDEHDDSCPQREYGNGRTSTASRGGIFMTSCASGGKHLSKGFGSWEPLTKSPLVNFAHTRFKIHKIALVTSSVVKYRCHRALLFCINSSSLKPSWQSRPCQSTPSATSELLLQPIDRLCRPGQTLTSSRISPHLSKPYHHG